jgi:hypothetical protein
LVMLTAADLASPGAPGRGSFLCWRRESHGAGFALGGFGRAGFVSREAPRLVGYSCLSPRQYFVRVIQRASVPPSCDGRTLALRWAADPVERPVPNRKPVFAQKFTGLLARESSLRLDVHESHPKMLPETGGRLFFYDGF